MAELAEQGGTASATFSPGRPKRVNRFGSTATSRAETPPGLKIPRTWARGCPLIGAPQCSGGPRHPPAPLFEKRRRSVFFLRLFLATVSMRVSADRSDGIFDELAFPTSLGMAGNTVDDECYGGGEDSVRESWDYLVLHRRHLTPAQRAMIAAELSKLNVGRPREPISGD